MEKKDSDGLHLVYEPENDDAEADVIFVHGLGGGSHSTWLFRNDKEKYTFFWPRELAADLKNCSVWTIGYPAGISTFGEPGMIIDKRATNISQKLANSNVGNKPIIFITHSMGGLIVKSLIVKSQTLPDIPSKNIVNSIQALVFCATPHKGSDYANAATILCKFLGGTQKHVDEMVSDSDHLDILHDQFIEWHRLNPIKVQSYAENIGLFKDRAFRRALPLGVVVSRSSANPGVAGNSVIDVDADHIGLVKPVNRNDDVYAGVHRFIKNVLEEKRGNGQQLNSIPSGVEEPSVEYSTVHESTDSKNLDGSSKEGSKFTVFLDQENQFIDSAAARATLFEAHTEIKLSNNIHISIHSQKLDYLNHQISILENTENLNPLGREELASHRRLRYDYETIIEKTTWGLDNAIKYGESWHLGMPENLLILADLIISKLAFRKSMRNQDESVRHKLDIFTRDELCGESVKLTSSEVKELLSSLNYENWTEYCNFHRGWNPIYELPVGLFIATFATMVTAVANYNGPEKQNLEQSLVDGRGWGYGPH